MPSSNTADNRCYPALSRLLLISLLPSSALFISPLQAEVASRTQFEAVMVVARKKNMAESVFEVPLAITAFGAEQLNALYIQNLSSLSYSTPNVQLDAVGTFPSVQNFSIRGQGINSSIPSVDPTVGTFVDGVYIGTTYGVITDVFDLESVEILRGPQGLLFGRNVTGGAVALRTARPTGEFGFKARVRTTDHNQHNVATSLQGVLIEDKLAAKFVAYRDDDKGYFDNNYMGSPDLNPGTPIYYKQARVGGQDVGQLETTMFRASLLYQASDDLDITFIAEHGKTEGQGAPWTRVDLQRDASTVDYFTTTADEIGVTDIEWQSFVLESNLAVSFGGGTITNILGSRELDAFSVADVDGFEASIFTLPGNTEQDQISNELRYAGSFMAGRWDVTAGLYYFQQDMEYREARQVLENTQSVALGGDMDHHTTAIFMSNDYHLNDELSITAGARYTKEDKDAMVISSGCMDLITFICPKLSLDDEWSNITPKLGVSYQFNDAVHSYAFWTKGFRSGGVNFRNAKPAEINPGPTKEEEQNSIEIGLKSNLMGGRLQINAAYFYNTIDDMQRELNIDDDDVIVLQGTVNAGDAIIQGVELEFKALLGDGFSVFGSVGYLDGGWDKKNPLYDPDKISALLRSKVYYVGDDLPRLSPWTASLGSRYEMSLEDWGSLAFQANYAFRDRAAYLDSNLEYFDQQHEVTASIKYLSANERWAASLYGQNLNDEARWGNLTKASFGTVGPMQKGRVIGLEAEYRY